MTQANDADNIPSRVLATGEAAFEVSKPATTTLVSMIPGSETVTACDGRTSRSAELSQGRPFP
jgi:hypothetical protein